jgi:3-oxoacyl-[acyl-carrier protein] reductase
MPFGRWGTPDDVARLVAFLVSDDGGWITGQVVDSEGGFRRSRLGSPVDRDA